MTGCGILSESGMRSQSRALSGAEAHFYLLFIKKRAIIYKTTAAIMINQAKAYNIKRSTAPEISRIKANKSSIFRRFKAVEILIHFKWNDHVKLWDRHLKNLFIILIFHLINAIHLP